MVAFRRWTVVVLFLPATLFAYDFEYDFGIASLQPGSIKNARKERIKSLVLDCVLEQSCYYHVVQTTGVLEGTFRQYRFQHNFSEDLAVKVRYTTGRSREAEVRTLKRNHNDGYFQYFEDNHIAPAKRATEVDFQYRLFHDKIVDVFSLTAGAYAERLFTQENSFEPEFADARSDPPNRIVAEFGYRGEFRERAQGGYLGFKTSVSFGRETASTSTFVSTVPKEPSTIKISNPPLIAVNLSSALRTSLKTPPASPMRLLTSS